MRVLFKGILIILFICNSHSLLFYNKYIIIIIKNKYATTKDKIEVRLFGNLKEYSPYFEYNKIVHILKMYVEYKRNKLVYSKIPYKYRYFVLYFCANHSVPVKLVYATFYWESGWSNKAIGKNESSYDIGICQLNSRYLEGHARVYFKSGHVGYFNPYNGFHNLEVGLNILDGLYVACDYSYKCALLSYNAGYATVMVYKNIPDSAYHYVRSIERIMKGV